MFVFLIELLLKHVPNHVPSIDDVDLFFDFTELLVGESHWRGRLQG